MDISCFSNEHVSRSKIPNYKFKVPDPHFIISDPGHWPEEVELFCSDLDALVCDGFAGVDTELHQAIARLRPVSKQDLTLGYLIMSKKYRVPVPSYWLQVSNPTHFE